MEREIPDNNAVQALADMVRTSSRAVIFTGAGISTESGIPDFRSSHDGRYLPNGR